MSFKKLKDRIVDLPLVLAGPMVRRLEPTSVSVWLALREPRDVRLHVFDPAGDFESDPTLTFAIGKFLHMVVVTARPPKALPDGAVLNYTISFTPPAGGPKQDLLDPGVVAPTKSEAQDLLVYPSDPKRLPSFMVPPASLDQMRIFHTSCRKIDGDGIDAFPAIDHAFDDALRHPNDRLRPTMLFLTGDQIYADGSVHELLDITTDIGGTLLGADEILPVVNKRPEDLPFFRTFVAVDDAGLKNPRAHPALSLGEFIALYLLTFSNVLWPPDHREHDDFTRGLPATRRIFANLATYMIFDDHELSDSWYLTRSWDMPLFKSELGRRVLQNALSAYALFQAWGNTPELFAPPITMPGKVFLEALVDWRTQNYAAASPARQVIARVLGIPDASSFEASKFDLSDDRFHQPPSQILPWHYTVPCKALSINVLDTYTWKKYGEEYEPGDHLPPRALDAQVHKIGSERVALYVASNVVVHHHPRTGGDPDSIFQTLLPGFGRAAGVVGVVAIGVLASGLYKKVEFWYILGALVGVALLTASVVSKFTTGHFIPPLGWLNRALRQVHFEEVGTEFEWHSATFERLLDRVARDSVQTVNNQQFARVVFLSGDVHHSFATQLSYFADFNNQGTPQLRASIAQLVSSPSKFVDESAESYDETSSGEFVGWKRASGNEKQEPKVKPGGEKVDWLGKGEFWITKIQPGLPKFAEPDNHRYKIEPIKPRREKLNFSSLAPKTRTFDEMLSGLDLHQRTVLLQARFSDTIRANNVSDVTFTVAGDQTKVRQDVWWWYSGIAKDPPGWFTRTFEVDMNPTNPPALP